MEIEYFENIKLNQKKFLGEYIADRDETIEYARKLDPQSFHIKVERPVIPNRHWVARGGYPPPAPAERMDY